jgi:predicted short-subunit dehydrogenase-like oxidoreductase (DUF2520 family)
LGATQSIRDRPLHDALTGPVARGDVATVEAQLAALASEPGLLAAYRLLGRTLLTLPSSIPDEARARLLVLFGAPA